MAYLVECVDGPVKDHVPSGQLILLEIKPCFYIQLPDDRWVYYYQTYVVSHPFPLESDRANIHFTGRRPAKKSQAKKSLPQATYKYSKKFGAVSEDHPDVQVHIKSYASRFQTRPPRLD